MKKRTVKRRPAARPATRRASSRRGTIESDTPIVPFVIAQAVAKEFDYYDDATAQALVNRAEEHYKTNEPFRKKLKARGNAGRDHLFAVMRNWMQSPHARAAMSGKGPAEPQHSGRRYNVVVERNDNKKKVKMNASPLSHHEATTFLSKISKHPWRQERLEEVEDIEERIRHSMAKELDIPADELEISDERGANGFGVGNFYEVSLERGHKSWTVAESDDDARALAIAMVKQMLEEEPENFTPSFIESHIDTDRLRKDLEDDVYNMAFEDLQEEAQRRPEQFIKDNNLDFPEPSEELMRKYAEAMSDEHSLLVAAPSADEIYAKLQEGDAEDKWIEIGEEPEVPETDIENLARDQTQERLKDPVGYLEEFHSREDAIKRAIEIAGIDVDAAAEEAVSADGEGHFLSSYDGHMHEAPGGLVYWRTN